MDCDDVWFTIMTFIPDEFARPPSLFFQKYVAPARDHFMWGYRNSAGPLADLRKNKICRVIIDSDSRFNNEDVISDDTTEPALPLTSNGLPFHLLLPHDKWGWNRFDGECKSHAIYYKGMKVIELAKIAHCYKGVFAEEDDDVFPNGDPKHHWYHFYVQHRTSETKDDKYFLSGTTLNFNGVPITNAHVHFNILL